MGFPLLLPFFSRLRNMLPLHGIRDQDGECAYSCAALVSYGVHDDGTTRTRGRGGRLGSHVSKSNEAFGNVIDLAVVDGTAKLFLEPLYDSRDIRALAEFVDGAQKHALRKAQARHHSTIAETVEFFLEVADFGGRRRELLLISLFVRHGVGLSLARCRTGAGR